MIDIYDSAEMGQVVAEYAWASEAEGRAWAIRPEALLRLHNVFDNRELMRAAMMRLESAASAGELEEPDDDGDQGQQADRPGRRRRGRPPRLRGDVAVVPLKGTLMPGGMSLLELLFGIKSGLAAFQDGFREAMDDPDIGAIVIDVDSPGGLVDQIPETAAMVQEAAKGDKEIVAVANTLSASAAYWIASQANFFYASPSSEVGSIGVYSTHMDNSKALANLGVKPTLISAGKYKVEGNPYEPLTDEAAKAIQESVNDYYDMFVKDVATGRNDSVGAVKNGYGEGRVLTAKRAVQEKLVDGIKTLDEAVSSLVSRAPEPSSNGSAFLGTEADRRAYADLMFGKDD